MFKMNKDTQNTTMETSGSDATMETVMKNIYSACDPNNSDLVPTSELIEYIRPYMQEDLSALETLKHMLDPENKNIFVAGEKFYNVMNEWTQKIASHSEEVDDGEFNRTPSQLHVLDDKLLPYSQSTPRPSFGQKLLSCEGLLNLSNVSSYNLSPTKAKEISIGGPEKTILEEEVKQLQHQLNRITGDMDMLKAQLVSSEEQNEMLLDDLERCRARLQSEQQVNGHLQENKNCSEDLKEEINVGKKRIEELSTKLALYEKSNADLNMYVQKLEKENTDLEERCAHFTKTEQNMRKEFFDLRTELHMKEHEILSTSKINEELRLKLCEKMSELEHVLIENELMDYRQQGLEKMLSSKRYSLPSHYNTCLDEMNFLMRGTTIPIYSSPLKNQSFSNSPLIKTVFAPNHKMHNTLNYSTPKRYDGLGIRKAFSLNTMSTRSLPNIFCSNAVQDHVGDAETEPQPLAIGACPYESLQTELFQVDPQFDHKDNNGTDSEYEEQINAFKVETEFLQKKLEKMKETCASIQDERMELEKKLSNLEIKVSEEIKTEKLVNELEENRQQLKDDFTRLQLELEKKEKEIFDFKNKFDFEPVYKKLEIEYSRKIAQLEELQENFKVCQNTVKNLTNLNHELDKTVANQKKELQETKEKLRHGEILSLNIEHTTNKVQAHIDSKSAVISELQTLNREFKTTTERLEKDLQEQIKQNKQLKDILGQEEDMANKLRHDNMILRSNLNVITQDYKNVLKTVKENVNAEKEMKAEYKNLHSKYNEQITKTSELVDQISKQNKDLSQLTTRYDEMKSNYSEELAKKPKLLEQILLLQCETENIKRSQKNCKDEIEKKLNDYEKSLHPLCARMEVLETENNTLKMDLQAEKQKSNAKLSEIQFGYERSGSTNENDDRKSYLDGDPSSNSIPKNRSFEKQKLTIDKLREDLRREKSKNQSVRERLTCHLQESEESKMVEKLNLLSTIDALKKKLEDQEEYYKHLCSASDEKIKHLSIELSTLNQQLSNALLNISEKDALLKRNFETNKATVEKLYKDFKDCKNLQAVLSIDLGTKEGLLKNISIENQNLKHSASSSETKVLELSTELACQESALNALHLDLASKNEELLALSAVLSDRDSKIDELISSTTDYEINFSNIRMELEKTEETCEKLKREMQTVRGNMATTDTTRDNELVTREEELNSSFDFDLQNVNGHFVKDETTSDSISSFTDVISHCCQELNRAFGRFVAQWRNKIESHPSFKHLPSIKLCQSLNIEDVLSVIVENIKAVILLLTMSAKASDPMDDSHSHLTYLTNQQNADASDPKTLKKFTLSPTKSPPNRSREEFVETEMVGTFEDQNSEKENSVPVGPSLRTMENFCEGENIPYYNSYLPLLSFDLSIQDAFPHVSDSILEKLGLHENSPKIKLTKEETEDLFTTFAIQVGLDSKDIQGRLQRQKDTCAENWRKYQYLLKDISMRLREHNCIGAMDPINPVFVLLEDVRFMMKDLMQSAGQLGVLTCEHRMTKCWNLVTNYTAIIKQDLEMTKHPSPNRSLPLQSRRSPAVGERVTPKNSKRSNKTDDNVDKDTKEYTGYRRCLSSLTHCLLWMSFVCLLFFIGVVCVHWQCKMNTEYKICPLDDFIKIISQRVGNPPY